MASHASTTPTTLIGDSSARELFALSDEQILEIEPQAEVASDELRVASQQHPAAPENAVQGTSSARATRPESAPTSPEARVTNHETQGTSHEPRITNHDSQVTAHDTAEPPPWLAAQMKDPWGGEEAREFWNGVQQARTEAAAYRAAIASPEDARALKELYPGGVSEARNAAQRARLLEEVDRAYFGGAGNSPEQGSAARAQLAQQLLREDPAAFREMVAAGLRALQAAGQGSGATPQSSDLPRLAKLLSDQGDLNVVPPFRMASSADQLASAGSSVVAQHAAPLQGNAATATTYTGQAAHESPVTSHQSLSAYAAFERAANEDLERSVGVAIERTLEQALPSAARVITSGQAEAQHSSGSAQDRAAPLQQKLSAAIRQDVEKALQGDRQLGEQVAQILASRRFDNDTREQVVRLISERAQQLVPGAAKRVLSEWTQTTLAAHRTRTQRSESNASRIEVAPASLPPLAAQGRPETRRLEASATNSRRVDYHKLSDEQILSM